MRRCQIFLIVCGLTMLMACAGSDGDSAGPSAEDGLRVASFDFAESELLAELYGQVLDGAGIPVVRLGAIGPREVLAPAMELDRVDLVPEYLGTALQFYGATTTDPDTTTSAAALADRVGSRGLVALDPADAQDANAVVVTRSLADTLRLDRISDLSPHAPTLRFGGPVECPDRPLCLQGLEEVYGLRFGEFVPQRSLQVTAEALRRGEVEVGLLFTTSSEVDDTDFLLLEDDRQLQPAENVVPLVRASALDRWGPLVADRLNQLSASLGTNDLRTMNRAVSEGGAVADVAFSWLVVQGLVAGE